MVCKRLLDKSGREQIRHPFWIRDPLFLHGLVCFINQRPTLVPADELAEAPFDRSRVEEELGYLEIGGRLSEPDDAPFYITLNASGRTENIGCVKRAELGLLFAKPSNLLCNDLEDVVFSKYPQLKDIPDRLYDLGAFHARMSGSGSSFFGLFESKNAAVAAESSFIEDVDTYVFDPV